MLSRFARTHRKALLRIQCTTTTKQMIHGLNSGIIYNYKENVVGKLNFSTAPNYGRMKFTVHSKYVPNWQFQTETDAKSTCSVNLKLFFVNVWSSHCEPHLVPFFDLWMIFRIDSALDWETSIINEGRSPNMAPSKPASCCPFLTESNVTNCVVGAPNTFDKGCADYVSHVVPRPSAVEFEQLTWPIYLDNECRFAWTLHNNRSIFLSNNFNYLYMLFAKANQSRKVFLLISK